ALAGGFADSKLLQLFLPKMLAGEHDPPVGHAYTMLKDLEEVHTLARQTGTTHPMSAQALELFRLLNARGGPRCDALELYKLSARTPLD
ncbi:MAG: NAD-binding protein, partial [Pseudomonadota bacterium]